MTIRFHCEDCQARIKVPEGAEGRKIRCPRCGAVHRVPDAVANEQTEVPVAEAAGYGSADEHQDAALSSLATAVDTLEDEPPTEADDFDHSPLDELAQEAPETDFEDDPDEQMLDEQEDYDEEDEQDEDPLNALAALADDPDDQPHEDKPLDKHEDDLLDQHEEEQEDPDEHDAVNALDALGGAADDDDETAFPSPEAPQAEPAQPQSMIPLARPRPQPQPTTLASPDGRSARPTPSAGSASPQPQAIPLSTRPSSARAQPKPIPLGDAMPATTQAPRTTTANAPSSTLLLVVGWTLRVLAFLAVGGAFKLMLVAVDLQWSLGECLLVLLSCLIAAAVVWGVGEIALAVRFLIARNR